MCSLFSNVIFLPKHKRYQHLKIGGAARRPHPLVLRSQATQAWRPNTVEREEGERGTRRRPLPVKRQVVTRDTGDIVWLGVEGPEHHLDCTVGYLWGESWIYCCYNKDHIWDKAFAGFTPVMIQHPFMWDTCSAVVWDENPISSHTSKGLVLCFESTKKNKKNPSLPSSFHWW